MNLCLLDPYGSIFHVCRVLVANLFSFFLDLFFLKLFFGKSSSRNTAGSMKRLKAAFFNSIENSKVDSQIGQDGEIFHPSPS